MDLAIALGQGIGLAVACGLVALLPIAVGSLGAMAGLVPGALGIYDDVIVAAASGVAGIANAIAAPLLRGPLRILLASGAGALACELAAGDELPYGGLAIGGVVAAAAAWVASRIVDPATANGPRGGVSAIVAGVTVLAAAAALIPFVGYVLVLVAAWFGRRARQVQDRKYAGLRVLR